MNRIDAGFARKQQRKVIARHHDFDALILFALGRDCFDACQFERLPLALR